MTSEEIEAAIADLPPEQADVAALMRALLARLRVVEDRAEELAEWSGLAEAEAEEG